MGNENAKMLGELVSHFLVDSAIITITESVSGSVINMLSRLVGHFPVERAIILFATKCRLLIEISM